MAQELLRRPARLVRADQGGDREHQLLRHHHPGPLRPDAVRAAAGRGAAVLPRSDGPSRATAFRARRRSPTFPTSSSGVSTASRRRWSRACPGARSTSRACGTVLSSARSSLACTSPGAPTAPTSRTRGAPKWWRFAAREVMPFLWIRARKDLLQTELAYQAEQRFPDLPRGPVHADLFRDNALWDHAPFRRGRLLFCGRRLLPLRHGRMRERLVPRDRTAPRRWPGSGRSSPATRARGRSPRSSSGLAADVARGGAALLALATL